ILLEAMCQTGLVALGIYLLSREVPRSELADTLTLFTHADVEFELPVFPGDTLRVEAEKLHFRRRVLRSRVTLRRGDAEVVASGTVSGMGVRRG
ncbi:MAG TPA: hotdog domain-containing protein, partial [Polyangiaceae bacterium]|nr:hotdog domain-containing protein [Polyangiaceae bacterium]